MVLFHDFSLKVARGSRVPPQLFKKTPKWMPKGDQMEARGVKVQPQGYKSQENLQHVAQWSQNGAPGATMEPQGLQKCKTHIKNSPKLQRKHTRRYPKVPNKEENPYTHKQPTNQPTNQRNKEGHKETNNRTNTHTHKSFELQTQTQTPAAGCSPKAT